MVVVCCSYVIFVPILKNLLVDFDDLASSTDCFLQCAEPFAFTTDHTLKVTHHNFDTNEIMIALKLHGIMSSSLLLIGLMVIGLGIYQYGNKI